MIWKGGRRLTDGAAVLSLDLARADLLLIIVHVPFLATGRVGHALPLRRHRDDNDGPRRIRPRFLRARRRGLPLSDAVRKTAQVSQRIGIHTGTSQAHYLMRDSKTNIVRNEIVNV